MGIGKKRNLNAGRYSYFLRWLIRLRIAWPSSPGVARSLPRAGEFRMECEYELLRLELLISDPRSPVVDETLGPRGCVSFVRLTSSAVKYPPSSVSRTSYSSPTSPAGTWMVFPAFRYWAMALPPLLTRSTVTVWMLEPPIRPDQHINLI